MNESGGSRSLVIIHQRQYAFFDWMRTKLGLEILEIYPTNWGDQYRAGGFGTTNQNMVEFQFYPPALRAIEKFNPSILYVQQELYCRVSRQLFDFRNRQMPSAALVYFLWENLHAEPYANPEVREIIDGLDWCVFGSTGARELLPMLLHKADVFPQVGVSTKLFQPAEIERPYDLVFVGRQACYDDQTEVLTRSGFKLFKDVTTSDEIITFNRFAGLLEYHKPEYLQAYPYTGNMIHFIGRQIDLLVTPEHKIWCRRIITGKKTEFGLRTAQDIYDNFVSGKFEFARVAGTFLGSEEVKSFTLPIPVGKTWKHFERISIPLETWLPFLGWWLAEGHVKLLKREGYSWSYRTIITQTKTENLAEIELVTNGIANQLGFQVNRWMTGPEDQKSSVFCISSKQLFDYLLQFGKAHSKFIPVWIKSLPPSLLRIFLSAMVRGDGHQRIGFSYTTTSKRLADDVQEIGLKIGMATFLSEQTSPEKYYRGKRIKPGKFYVVYLSDNYLTPALWQKPVLVPYSGIVYDLTVRNHLIFVRRNGKVCWSSNSIKGWDAIEKMLERHPEWKLTRAGGAGYSDMPNYYNSAKVHVSPVIDTPYWIEQHASYSNLEALSCGLRVVTSRSKAILEYLHDVPGVFFCEQNDVHSLTEAVEKALEKWELNDAGRRRAISNVGYQAIAEKTVLALKKGVESRVK